MTYRGAALQAALHARLSGDPAMAGVPVFDAVPPGPVPSSYVLIGPEEVRDASDLSGRGAEHRIALSVISAAAGFMAAKEIATRLGEVIDRAELALAEGRVVSVRFQRAVARRLDAGTTRRIDLTFRVRLDG